MLPSEKREGLRSCFSKRERRNTITGYRIFPWKGEDVQMWPQVSGNVGRCIKRRHSFKKALTVDLWFMFAVSTLWANVCVCVIRNTTLLCAVKIHVPYSVTFRCLRFTVRIEPWPSSIWLSHIFRSSDLLFSTEVSDLYDFCLRTMSVFEKQTKCIH